MESGSRGWGFPSPDSDYDVRFLYVRRPAWYLAIDRHARREVIETPVEGLWDVNGWDLRKALALFRKSNAPLLEWLQSPIVYREPFSTASQMRDHMGAVYSPVACLHHYLKTAHTNYQGGEARSIKSYFYVLRPLLACRWIEQGRGPVPMLFQRLVEGTDLPGPTRAAVATLLETKRTSAERQLRPHLPELDEFIAAELARHAASRVVGAPHHPAAAPLNRIFYDALREVWGIEVRSS